MKVQIHRGDVTQIREAGGKCLRPSCSKPVRPVGVRRMIFDAEFLDDTEELFGLAVERMGAAVDCSTMAAFACVN